MVEILLIVGLALIVSNWLAERFNLVAPIVLIVAGMVISLIPGTPMIYVSPEIILQVFLPILLYWEALNISLRGIRRSLRGVIINGTLMVLFVAVATGVIGQLVGLTLGAALLIGAAIGPTDATAVAALGKGISRRQMIVLRAESLINDGTALVVFALAVEYAGGHSDISAGRAGLSFLISFVGGGLAGFATGWLIARIGRFVENPMLGNIFRLFTPFLAYYLAELVEASGVLAVVVCGLYMAQAGPKFQTTTSRFISRPFFGMVAYILNSLLFLLVGLSLVEIVRTLSSDTLTHAVLVTVVLYIAMMLARWIFTETVIRLIRLLDRRPEQKLRRTTFLERLVSTVAGFRGAISLAVAFSVPETLANGEPFPYRDLIIFVTSGIVILSLIVQGALLPMVVRASNKNPNPLTLGVEEEDEREINAALMEVTRVLLANLDDIAQTQNVDSSITERIRTEYELKPATRWAVFDGTEEDREQALADREAEQRLRLATVRYTRQYVIDLRDQGKIDDEGLIYLLDLIDLEEIRVTGPIAWE